MSLIRRAEFFCVLAHRIYTHPSYMSRSHQRTMEWLNDLICFRAYLACLGRRRPKLRYEVRPFTQKSKNFLEQGQLLVPIVDVIPYHLSQCAVL